MTNTVETISRHDTLTMARPDQGKLLSREGSMKKIGFTIVGEGDGVRILPLDSEMILEMRRCSLTSNASLALLEEQLLEGWTCELCSYENVDKHSQACSVCGSSRGGEPVKPRLADGHGEERILPSSQTSSPHSKRNIQVESQPETGKIENDHLKNNEVSDFSTRPSSSMNLHEMMNLSLSNWSSVSDNGPWVCATCTYMNRESLHLACEVCGHSRSKSKDRSNDTGHQSLTEMFNASFGGSQTKLPSDTLKIICDLEGKAVEREQMDEVLAEQSRILNELHIGQLGVDQSRDNTSGNTRMRESVLEEATRQLRKSREALSRMQALLEQERKEQELAEEAQHRQRSEIERYGELSSTDRCYPEADSTAALELMAQQRMLDDWKSQRSVREEQIQNVHEQQEQLLEALKQKRLLQEYEVWEK